MEILYEEGILSCLLTFITLEYLLKFYLRDVYRLLEYDVV
jgi:hypothetical protein